MPCYHALEGYLVKYHLLSKSNNLFTIFSQIAPCASYCSSYIQRPFLLSTGDPTTLWSRIVCNRTELSVAFVCASSQPPCHFGTTLVYQDLMDPIRERQFANLRTALNFILSKSFHNQLSYRSFIIALTSDIHLARNHSLCG